MRSSFHEHLLVALGLLVALTSVSTKAAAQDPAKLPAVIVKAPVEKPGPRTIAGIVRDTFAVEVDGAEITIPSIQRRALTDAAGRFRLIDIRPGTYSVRARKIGFAPQVRSLVVDDSGGVTSFELVPMARTLSAVVTSAAQGGLSGTVGDTAYQAIAGAEVRLLGSGQVTKTDSMGRFFVPLKAGKYFVVVQRAGYTDRLVSVTIPRDSGRHLALMLPPRSGGSSTREAWNYADFGERMARVLPGHATIYSHDDLTRIGYEWILEAVQRGFSLAGGKTVISNDCAGTLNGGPKSVPLAELTVDDVDTIEIYPPGTARVNLLQKRRGRGGFGGIPITNTDEADFWNRGVSASCPTVYVWTR